MKIRSAWHIHSHHSPCGNPEATLAKIVREVRGAGITSMGITDHLHCRLSVPSLRACRQEYDALADAEGVHFGVEVTCLRRYDVRQIEALGKAAGVGGIQAGGPPQDALALDVPPGFLEELGAQYIIGGAHGPLGAPPEREAVIRAYHRQNMFLATHPQIDIVAHPWWWGGAIWQDADGRYRGLPWFDDFSVIPKSMHDEFAAAAREHGTVIEINARAVLLNWAYPETFRPQYLEYLAFLKESGVVFSVGSDSHAASYAGGLAEIAPDLERMGIPEGDLWRPAGPRTSRPA